MQITTELVDYISQLSRLSLLEDEKQAMTAHLERIVDYMDTLNRLDTADIEPMSHVFPVKNVLREDVAEHSMDRAALLANAPAPDDETFLTPKSVETMDVRTSLVYRLRVQVDDPDNVMRQGMPVTVTLVEP